MGILITVQFCNTHHSLPFFFGGRANFCVGQSKTVLAVQMHLSRFQKSTSRTLGRLGCPHARGRAPSSFAFETPIGATTAGGKSVNAGKLHTCCCRICEPDISVSRPFLNCRLAPCREPPRGTDGRFQALAVLRRPLSTYQRKLSSQPRPRHQAA